jgi:hypothetical protein
MYLIDMEIQKYKHNNIKYIPNKKQLRRTKLAGVVG